MNDDDQHYDCEFCEEELCCGGHVERRYNEEQLMSALLVFAAMYMTAPEQKYVDAAERALDMLTLAAHEKDLQSDV